MNIVLAGTCAQIAEIEALFHAEGFDVIRAETPASAKEWADSVPVVLLSESAIDPLLINDSYAARKVSNLFAKEPIVILLDHPTDTPDYILTLVLRRAVSIAAGKRPVYVLARSVRSGLPDMEKLYAEARSLGASFVKYEDVSVRDLENGLCQLEVNDGASGYTLNTPLLINCAQRADPALTAYAKALRLHTHGGDLINADRWFLSPGRTSRRGVFFIDTGLILSGRLHETVISIANDAKQAKDAVQNVFAYINAQKCAFCYTCYRVCPHGALEPDTSAPAMKVIEPSCDACGMCVAICPGHAIELRGAVCSDPKPDGQTRILAFCCENSAAIAAKTAFDGMHIQTESIPCGGNLNGERIASALKAYDRVLVAVCADEACKHFEGSKRACLQTEKVRRSIAKLGMDPERIGFLQISHAMPSILKTTAEQLLPEYLNDGGSGEKRTYDCC